MTEAPDNSKKVKDTLPISRACAQTNVPQRDQLARNSFCLHLVSFPYTSFITLKLNPLSFHASVLFHRVPFISVPGRSGEQGLLWDCQSLSVYICK